jgi:hypothetical protein
MLPPLLSTSSYAPTNYTSDSVVSQQKSPSCPTGTLNFLPLSPPPHLILFIPGWADPPTIGEIIHGKKLTVADELRIGQENVDKVSSRVCVCVRACVTLREARH